VKANLLGRISQATQKATEQTPERNETFITQTISDVDIKILDMK